MHTKDRLDKIIEYLRREIPDPKFEKPKEVKQEKKPPKVKAN